MKRMFKGRCNRCQRITPVTKEQWYKPVKCSWCGEMFVPFATEKKDVTIQDTYTHMGVTKSLEKAKGRVTCIPRRLA